MGTTVHSFQPLLPLLQLPPLPLPPPPLPPALTQPPTPRPRHQPAPPAPRAASSPDREQRHEAKAGAQGRHLGRAHGGLAQLARDDLHHGHVQEGAAGERAERRAALAVRHLRVEIKTRGKRLQSAVAAARGGVRPCCPTPARRGENTWGKTTICSV